MRVRSRSRPRAGVVLGLCYSCSPTVEIGDLLGPRARIGFEPVEERKLSGSTIQIKAGENRRFGL